MKNLVKVLLLVVVLATMLTACGKFTCDTCNKEKSGKQHKSEVFGEEVVMCDDCYEELEKFSEGF